MKQNLSHLLKEALKPPPEARAALAGTAGNCSHKRIKKNRREKFMKLNIVYKEEKGWFVGHIQEYPNYESQGKTLEELRDNLIEIYDDIRKGLVPDAEPFQILEVAI
ncbi:MAG TPA: hypothetical protein VLK23_06330 [Thermodesulfobacteriota bacterium]|nr:hypothetical protein [Thermodesulfobacteriota bacterium]